MRRRTGKIATLPKVLRDQVNAMLRDGISYARIELWLTEQGHPGVNSENISHWYKGSGAPEDGSGYQDWLNDQVRLDDLRIKREAAMDFVKQTQGSDLQEAALQLAASHAYEIFLEVDPKDVAARFKENPELIAPLVNATARGFGESLKFQRYRDDVQRRKETIQRELDQAKGKGGITPETLHRIEQELNLL